MTAAIVTIACAISSFSFTRLGNFVGGHMINSFRRMMHFAPRQFYRQVSRGAWQRPLVLHPPRGRRASYAVRVLHEKTREENWIPLFDDNVPLYPELMAELDAMKRERIHGLMLRRDWGARAPWPTWPNGEPDLTLMSRKTKQII